jgi:periplasmic divalent cation tolerance protein
MKEYIQIMTTGAKEDMAGIARKLVEARLAACVQIGGPIRSTYWWEGKVEEADEWLCIIKTRKDLYPEVEKSIRQLHSYIVPEILALPIVAGNPDYLQWLGEELKTGQV